MNGGDRGYIWAVYVKKSLLTDKIPAKFWKLYVPSQGLGLAYPYPYILFLFLVTIILFKVMEVQELNLLEGLWFYQLHF